MSSALTDVTSRRIGSNFAQLAKDALFDADGNLTFKPELWADVRQKIIPGFIDQVGYVPIPRIEYTDEQLDLVAGEDSRTRQTRVRLAGEVEQLGEAMKILKS